MHTNLFSAPSRMISISAPEPKKKFIFIEDLKQNFSKNVYLNKCNSVNLIMHNMWI